MRVLSIEDYSNSVAEVVGALKAEGIKVREVESVQEAKTEVVSELFDFILCDARLPDQNGSLDFRAGPIFLECLRRGEFGELNRETPCLILTSYPLEVNARRIDISHFGGVVSKPTVTPTLIGMLLGIDLSGAPAQLPGEVLIDDLLVVNAPYSPEDDAVRFSVPAWAGDVEVVVGLDELPPDVAFAYIEEERPLYVWAQVNVAAQDADSVAPRGFRLHFSA